jgi:hypothetical protein
MSKCRHVRTLFVDALYNELTAEQKKAFKMHLNGCSECSKAYIDFTVTLKTMSQRKRVEPDPDFWTGYWDRLAPRLKVPAKKPSPIKDWRQWIPEFLPLPRWAYQVTAAVALLVIGIFIGRNALGPTRSVKIIPQLAERREISPGLASYQNRTSQYLEKSKILLLGIINFDAETEDPIALDFSRKQQISQELVQEAGVLKKGLTRYGAEDRFIELVSDLEVILLQIANLEKEHDLSAIDMVRSGVDRKGILLKITIEEMRRSVPPFNEKTNHIST